jgi:hypothetical protein
MSSDNHEAAAWEGIQHFTDRDYDDLNPHQPEQSFMQMWVVIVCLNLMPIPTPRGDFPEGSQDLESRRTYVGWWKDMQAPLPVQDDLSDDALSLLQKRFLLFFETDWCQGILKKNVWIGRGVMKIIGVWTAYLTRFAIEIINYKMDLRETSNAPQCERMRQRAEKLLQYLYPKLAFTAEQAAELEKIGDYALVQRTTAFLKEQARSVVGPGRVAETGLSGICTAWDTHESSRHPPTIDSRASETSDSPTDIPHATEFAVESHLARMSQIESKYWVMKAIQTLHESFARDSTAASSGSGPSVTGPE